MQSRFLKQVYNIEVKIYQILRNQIRVTSAQTSHNSSPYFDRFSAFQASTDDKYLLKNLTSFLKVGILHLQWIYTSKPKHSKSN